MWCTPYVTLDDSLVVVPSMRPSGELQRLCYLLSCRDTNRCVTAALCVPFQSMMLRSPDPGLERGEHTDVFVYSKKKTKTYMLYGVYTWYRSVYDMHNYLKVLCDTSVHTHVYIYISLEVALDITYHVAVQHDSHPLTKFFLWERAFSEIKQNACTAVLVYRRTPEYFVYHTACTSIWYDIMLYVWYEVRITSSILYDTSQQKSRTYIWWLDFRFDARYPPPVDWISHMKSM